MAEYKSMLLPTLLFEMKGLSEGYENKPNAMRMDYLRSVCCKKRRERVKNECCLNECGVTKKKYMEVVG